MSVFTQDQEEAGEDDNASLAAEAARSRFYKMDSKEMGEPFPVVIAPLLVEPTKPRLIYDARYVNAFLNFPATETKGLGLVPTCF